VEVYCKLYFRMIERGEWAGFYRCPLRDLRGPACLASLALLLAWRGGQVVNLLLKLLAWSLCSALSFS
jgi:hypothetical protein